MARPMILIKQDLLKELTIKHKTGVPICRLVRDHNLIVSAPTLRKIVGYYDLMHTTKNVELHDMIHKSLFPDWLYKSDKQVVLQPSDYKYIGKMPLGKWEANTWAEGEL